MPSLPYADSLFGTAKEFAREFTIATGLEASHFSAAAAASGFVYLTALQRTLAACDLSALRPNVTADEFMWEPRALSCSGGGVAGAGGVGAVQYLNVSGQMMLRNVLNTLQIDTFFGPVGFNNYRQNVYHPPVVAQVGD